MSIQLFVDLDGVLADFNAGVKRLTGRLPEELPPGVMWSKIARAPDFYTSLDWMPDGEILWQAVKPYQPIILTGLPRGSWAEPQKRAWCRRMLGDHVQVLTCMSREKAVKARELLGSDAGMILIDDRVSLQEAWQNEGGVFIWHSSAEDSINALEPYKQELVPKS